MNNAVPEKVFGQLAAAILRRGARRATKYLGEKLTVKATRRVFRKCTRQPTRTIEIVFTVGAPNCAEREFIKRAKRVGEPLPIKRIQVK